MITMFKRPKMLLGLAAVAGISTIAARRQGYDIGPQTLVQCRRGHVFSTIWIPAASVKAIRLGWYRFQWCPIGHHWTLVHPIKTAELSSWEREAAMAHPDIRVP